MSRNHNFKIDINYIFSDNFIIKPLVMANLALGGTYLFVKLFEISELLPLFCLFTLVYISFFPRVFPKDRK